MKQKLLSLLLAGLLAFSLTGCQKQEESQQGQPQNQGQDQNQPQDSPEDDQNPADPAEEITVRVAALKGPTAMGMVKWMEDAARE